MAEVYEIQLPSGETVDFEGDAPPNPVQIRQMMAAVLPQYPTPSYKDLLKSYGDEKYAQDEIDRFKSAGVGDSFNDPISGLTYIKAGDDSYVVPDYKPGEDPEAALRSAALGVVPGGLAMRTAGFLSGFFKGTKALKFADAATKAEKVAIAAKKTASVAVPIAGAAAVGIGSELAEREAVAAISPEAGERLRKDVSESPGMSLLGGLVGGSAPYQRLAPTVGARLMPELAGRGLGAGIGGGLQTGAEMFAADGQPLSPEAKGRIRLAYLGGAMFNEPTVRGQRAFDKGSSISDMLGNASTKPNLPEGQAAAAEIALRQAPPPEPVPMPEIVQPELAKATPKATGMQKTIESGLGIGQKKGVEKDALSYIDEVLTEAEKRIAQEEKMAEIELRRKEVEIEARERAAEMRAKATELAQREMALADAEAIEQVPASEVTPQPVGEYSQQVEASKTLQSGETGLTPPATKPRVRVPAVPTPEVTTAPDTGEQVLKIGTAEYVKAGGEWYRGTGQKVTEAPILRVLDANAPKAEPQKLDFAGVQEGIPGKIPDMELWNISKDITDPSGRVLHPSGSTVSRQTLEGYGIKVPAAPEAPVPAPIKPSDAPEATKTTTGQQTAPKAKRTPAKRVPVDDEAAIEAEAARQGGVKQAGEAGIVYNPFSGNIGRRISQTRRIDAVEHISPDGDPVFSFEAIGRDKDGEYRILAGKKVSAEDMDSVLGEEVGKKVREAIYNSEDLDEAAGTIRATVDDITSADFRSKFGTEAGGVNPTVAANIGAPVVGGAVGSQIGDTPEERRRNALIGAGLGAGVGLGSTALRSPAVKAARQAAKAENAKARGDLFGLTPVEPATVDAGMLKSKPKETPKLPVKDVPVDTGLSEPPPVEGSSPIRMPKGPVRGLAEGVIESTGQPKEVRKKVAADPSIIYDEFSLNDFKAQLKGMADDELNNLRASGEPNDRAGATIELANRASARGEFDLAGDLYAEASTMFTSSAQLFNVAKLVEDPVAYVKTFEQMLVDAAGKTDGKPNRILTPAQKQKIRELGADEIRANQELAIAAKDATEDFSAANEAAYKEAQKKVGEARKAIKEFGYSVLPQSYGDIFSKAVQGVLLTPYSLIINPVGNALWAGIRKGASSIATPLDAAFSAITGRKRAISKLSPLPSIYESKKFAEGIKAAAQEFFTGPSAESYAKAEVNRGFRPIRSITQAWTGKGMATLPSGEVAMSDRVRGMVEGLIGAQPEVMFRMLSFGDKPFRRAEEAASLLEQGRLRGLKGRELDKFLEFPDKKAREIMERDARIATFSQENRGVTKLNQMLDKGIAEFLGLDKIPAAAAALKVFGRMQVPFRQFPVNYLMTALNFAAPDVAFAKALYYSTKGKDQRRAISNMTEGLIGLTMYAVADMLWDNGLITGPVDKDAKVRDAQYANMKPMRINISGLERLQNGEDPSYRRGDDTRDWSKMGIPAVVLYLRSQQRGFDEKEASKLGTLRKDVGRVEKTGMDFVTDRFRAFPGMASFAMDQSFLAGTSSLLEAFRDPDPDSPKRELWLSNMFRVISSLAVPNTVEAVARAKYEFIPELRGDNIQETLGNIWKFKTFQLPEGEDGITKIDMWGDPIRRAPESANPYIYQFLDVTRSGREGKDEFKQKLFDLYDKTGSTDVYPALVSKSIELADMTAKLLPQDEEAYKILVGKKRRELAEDFVLSGGTESDNPWESIYTLGRIYEAAKREATSEFLSEEKNLRQYFPSLLNEPEPTTGSRTIRKGIRRNLQDFNPVP
jgi:hypothetical protein